MHTVKIRPTAAAAKLASELASSGSTVQWDAAATATMSPIHDVGSR